MQISNYANVYNPTYKRQAAQQPSFEASLIPKAKSAVYENFMFKKVAFRYFDRKKGLKIAEGLKDLVKKVAIPNGEKGIYGWEVNPKDSKKYVLFLHGIRGSSKIPPNQLLMEEIAKTGKYGILTPEYRGTAELTQHNFSIDNIVEDARASLDYLYKKGIKPEDITVVSHCLGALPGAQLAKSEKGLHKIIMVSPINQDMNVIPALFDKLHIKLPGCVANPLNKLTSLFLTESFNFGEAIKNAKVPVTVVSPEKDALLTPKQLKKLAEEVPALNNIVTVAGGRHSLGKKNCEAIIGLLD